MEAQIKEEIKKLVKQESWFSLDDDDDDYLLFATRDHGDVGDEEPGIEDIREGQRVGRLIRDRFWDVVEVELEIVDEWVHLNITDKE
jgi:hypothetical protein